MIKCSGGAAWHVFDTMSTFSQDAALCTFPTPTHHIAKLAVCYSSTMFQGILHLLMLEHQKLLPSAAATASLPVCYTQAFYTSQYYSIDNFCLLTSPLSAYYISTTMTCVDIRYYW